jgi:hypothetical protein
MVVKKLPEPDLDKMWRTWIMIHPGKEPIRKLFQDTIRLKLQNILLLQKKGKITWFCFLWHKKVDDPANLYFDIMFTTDSNDPDDFLPEYCIDTKKILPDESINGIDESLLVGEDIKEAWRIIGEQSEFIINMVCSHKGNVEIPPSQIAQFIHFFMNPLGYAKNILFFPKAHPDAIEALISQPIFQMRDILGGELFRS